MERGSGTIAPLGRLTAILVRSGGIAQYLQILRGSQNQAGKFVQP